MTVRQLIAELSTYNQDADVEIATDEGVDHVTGSWERYDEEPPVVVLEVQRT